MQLPSGEPRTIRRASFPGTPELNLEDWSPDNRSILGVTRQPDGNRQVVLFSADGDSMRVLKSLGWNTPVRVNFSPDGRYIAYDLPTDQRSRRDRDIYLRELATGRETALIDHPGNDFLLGWAPDGKHILFGSDRSGTRGAWLIEVADGKGVGEPMLVRPDLWGISGGSLVPDGSFFFHVGTGNYGLYVASLDPATGRVSGAPTLMPRSGEQDEFRPEWSPDGRLIATVVNHDRSPGPNSREWAIRIWSVEKGEYRDLALPIDMKNVSVIWEPDGRSLLVRSQEKSEFSVRRLDVQSGKLEPVFTLPPGVLLGLMRVKPDGHALVYFPSERKGVDEFTRSIAVRDLVTGAERTHCRRNVPASIRRMYGSLSPDGSTRASVLLDDSTKSWLLQTESVEDFCSGNPRTLLTIPRNELSGWPGTSWSPDGRWLIFLRRVTKDPDPRSEIWRIPVGGGAPERLGLSMTGLTSQTISPDGRRMAFIGGESHDELWVMTNILPTLSAPVTPR